MHFVDQEPYGPTTAVHLMRAGREAAGLSKESARLGGSDDDAGMLARLMALYIVVAVGKVGDLIPWLHNIPLAKLVAAFAVFFAIRGRARVGAASWKSVPPAKLTIAVMGVTTISILWSVLRSDSFGVITGSVLAIVVILLLVIKAARGWTPVRTILHGIVFAAIVLVASVFTTTTFGDRMGYSSSYDPNDFAYVLIGLLPIVVTFSAVSRRTKRLVYFGIAGLMTLAILLTQSRGGLLGLVIEILALTFLLPVARRGQLQFRITKSGVIARVALLAFIGIILWNALPGDARTRLGSITNLASDYNVTTAPGAQVGRLGIWSRNLPLIFDRPWGFGAGSFEAVDGLFAGGRYRAPHNTFLQALIELGIPGFILFIATIVSSFRYLRVSPKFPQGPADPMTVLDEPRAFARGIGVGLAGLCVSGFFLSAVFANVFWTLVTLSCAVGIVRRQMLSGAAEAIAGAPKQPSSGIADKSMLSPREVAGSSRSR